jgi:hypothetical protein
MIALVNSPALPFTRFSRLEQRHVLAAAFDMSASRQAASLDLPA